MERFCAWSAVPGWGAGVSLESILTSAGATRVRRLPADAAGYTAIQRWRHAREEIAYHLFEGVERAVAEDADADRFQAKESCPPASDGVPIPLTVGVVVRKVVQAAVAVIAAFSAVPCGHMRDKPGGKCRGDRGDRRGVDAEIVLGHVFGLGEVDRQPVRLHRHVFVIAGELPFDVLSDDQNREMTHRVLLSVGGIGSGPRPGGGEPPRCVRGAHRSPGLDEESGVFPFRRRGSRWLEGWGRAKGARRGAVRPGAVSA